MSMIVSRVLLSALFLSPLQADPAVADSVLHVPFEYGSSGTATLPHPESDDEQALPVRDTIADRKERTTTIKFSTANSLMLVKATINGKQGAFILDTGAISSLISLELAGIKGNPTAMK